MAGGTWDTQNKSLPGVYINFKASPQLLTATGIRGVVAIAKSLNWGMTGEITEINSISDTFTKLGYDISDPSMLWVNQIFIGGNDRSGANKILVYRKPATGEAAAAFSVGNGFNIQAQHGGTRGNDITISSTADPDSAIDEDTFAVFTVKTFVDGLEVDSQTVGSFTSVSVNTPAKVGDLVDNSWVIFGGPSDVLITPFAGTPLTGGANGTVAATADSSFLSKIEPYSFNIIIYDGADTTAKQSYTNFVQRRGNELGYYSQACMAGYPGANSEFVISVLNGLILDDGTTLTPEQCTWWVGGISAGAASYESNTYTIHPTAVAANPEYDTAELIDSVNNGQIAFITEFDNTKLMTDINTFSNFTVSKPQYFGKNKVIRTLWRSANELYEMFATGYIGRVLNNEVGRNLFRQQVIGYFSNLEADGSIQNFTADDVEVLEGNNKDSIVINVWIQPTDAIEKIYMSITVS